MPRSVSNIGQKDEGKGADWLQEQHGRGSRPVAYPGGGGGLLVLEHPVNFLSDNVSSHNW